MLNRLMQIDSLSVSADESIVSDWVNILSVIVAGTVIIGGIFLLRHYLSSKRK